MTTPPLAYIIILNWNGYQDTIECVESCRKLSYPNYRLIIVDNGSTDGSEALLRGRFPDIEVVQTGSNLGFTGGNNIGIRHALGKGADYVILLNNDTIVDREFAAELIKAAEADTSVGMVCSKIYFYDRPDIIWYAGASFYPWLGWGRHRGYNQHDEGQFDVLEQTDRPTGCTLMVSRGLCEAIGLLREEFFCYCEDVDWGLRAKNARYKIVYVPTSKIWHKESRSTGGSSSGVSHYYFIRNMFLCLDTNEPQLLPLRFFRYCSIIVTAFLSLFTQKVSTLNGLRYLCRGVSDYFRGRFGELKQRQEQNPK